MKILVGGFVAESNEHVNHKTKLEDFTLKYGSDVIDSLYVSELARENDIEIIPALYADGRGGGVVKKDAFGYIQNTMLEYVEKYYREVDAIFMFIHGASHVEGFGSGDHALIENIRKITGKHLPIAIVSDPHGNMTEDFTKHTTIHRTFRHSPHTDRPDTHHIVFNLLLDLLNKRQNIVPAIKKIPVMVGGERSVSTDEPMVSINKFLDEIEADKRVMAASLFIGYVRHDSDKCGAAAVVVPSTEKDQEYAEECAEKIYYYVISKANEFQFHGTAMELDESIETALEQDEGPVYITDSGDNCTAGAAGYDTVVLKEFMKRIDLDNKNILFACIADPNSVQTYLSKLSVGSQVSFELGMDVNEYSRPVHIEGEIIAIGKLHHHYGDPDSVGRAYTIRLNDYPIDIVVAEHAVSFAEEQQYEHAGISWNDYDLTIVKQGYLYPDLKARANYYVMALTDGATNQRTERLNYKLIRRPMYPYDPVDAL